jgi:hypothetical protein
MTIMPDIEEELQKSFDLNSVRHIMLLVSYLAKLLELREPYVRVVLTSYFTKIFDEFTDRKAKIEQTLKYDDIPLVILSLI